jgi:hypothetical protein
VDTVHPTQQQATTDVAPTPADLLRGAALYLERHGWTRDNYFAHHDRPTPPACVLGALAMAVYGQATDDPYSGVNDLAANRMFCRVADYLDCHVALATAGVLDSVVLWNDDESRTAEQVIAALREAAAIWDRQHPGGAA